MEIVTLTKALLEKHINNILIDITDFEFNNWKKDNFFLFLPDKWTYSLALIHDSIIAGFSVNSRKSSVFYIHFLYIIKKHRSSGYGKLLLKECEKTAIDNNHQVIQLKCHKENSTALKFYLNYSYIIADEHLPDTKYYLLEKKLII
jgi:ribosomal protein S18 acetylase RimI-like enzyme